MSATFTPTYALATFEDQLNAIWYDPATSDDEAIYNLRLYERHANHERYLHRFGKEQPMVRLKSGQSVPTPPQLVMPNVPAPAGVTRQNALDALDAAMRDFIAFASEGETILDRLETGLTMIAAEEEFVAASELEDHWMRLYSEFIDRYPDAWRKAVAIFGIVGILPDDVRAIAEKKYGPFERPEDHPGERAKWWQSHWPKQRFLAIQTRARGQGAITSEVRRHLP